jgi:hypothetical protein
MVKILTDLESTYQGLSYEVLHDMVPSISKFDMGYPIFDLGVNHNEHSRSTSKTNQPSGRPYPTCVPVLEFIQLKIVEK